MADDPVATKGNGIEPAPRPALDELMMAMDVVDTLRHNELLALKELEQEGRDEVLKERLKRLYESQGLSVSDAILEEGIRALKESRFTYNPPAAGFKRTLANLWIRRVLYGKFVAVALIFMMTAFSFVWIRSSMEQNALLQTQTELQETLPARLKLASEVALGEAKTADAKQRIDLLVADAQSALKREQRTEARAAITSLELLYKELARNYDIRVYVKGSDYSAVYRIPDINTGARNYYLIVEAVGQKGDIISLPITSEENGKTSTVNRWGIRVPFSTYEMVRRDKQDDGIIQNRLVGEKPRGALKPVYTMSVMGSAITEW